jgi:hypothetical protein
MSHRFGYSARGNSSPDVRGAHSALKTPRPQAVLRDSIVNVSPGFSFPLNERSTRNLARSTTDVKRGNVLSETDTFLTSLTSATTTNSALSKFDFTRFGESSQNSGATGPQAMTPDDAEQDRTAAKMNGRIIGLLAHADEDKVQ